LNLTWDLRFPETNRLMYAFASNLLTQTDDKIEGAGWDYWSKLNQAYAKSNLPACDIPKSGSNLSKTASTTLSMFSACNEVSPKYDAVESIPI
jgi:hypothetical protein